MEPKSKRFCWPADLHEVFVSAVFDVGLKSSTSLAIFDQLPTTDLGAVEHLLATYRSARRVSEVDHHVAKKQRIADRGIDIARRHIDLVADSEDLVRLHRPRLRARHRELSEALRFDDLHASLHDRQRRSLPTALKLPPTPLARVEEDDVQI